MKFKREDVGLYFALGLVGGGIGLLVGAFVASRRAVRSIEIEEPDDEEYGVGHYEYESPTYNDVDLVEEEEDSGYSDELLQFIDSDAPSAMQVELIHSGLVTIDDVRLAMSIEDEAEQISYQKGYRPLPSTKPDLEALTEFPEDMKLDGKYELSTTLPEGRDRSRLREIYYDPEDDTLVQMKKGNPIPLHSLDGILSNEAWNTILSYLVSNISPIFAYDRGTAKLYSFELMPQEEDDVGDADSPVL
jgi:hypothetical protein